jgi:zinc/manganese transport system substrate-binding protein
MTRPSRTVSVLLASALALATLVAAGCTPPTGTPAPGPRLRVVAAENFWGSIAAQLGDSRARVTNIISNPNTDPHDYEPTVADARAMADARLVIINGAGYDTWAQRLLAANPDPNRVVIDVGALAGVPAGGNPHQWYSPAVVRSVVAAIAQAYARLDPARAASYRRQRTAYETSALAHYEALVADIRAKYAGIPIGASESVVTPLADGLGLTVLTPPSFLAAVSEGTGPSASDKSVVDAQIRTRQVKVFIYNMQNATPDVAALVTEARAYGIPVVTLTETMVPSSGTFQGWQAGQLERLAAALKQATGR